MQQCLRNVSRSPFVLCRLVKMQKLSMMLLAFAMAIFAMVRLLLSAQLYSLGLCMPCMCARRHSCYG